MLGVRAVLRSVGLDVAVHGRVVRDVHLDLQHGPGRHMVHLWRPLLRIWQQRSLLYRPDMLVGRCTTTAVPVSAATVSYPYAATLAQPATSVSVATSASNFIADAVVL